MLVLLCCELPCCILKIKLVIHFRCNIEMVCVRVLYIDPVHTGPDPYGHHIKSQDEHDS